MNTFVGTERTSAQDFSERMRFALRASRVTLRPDRMVMHSLYNALGQYLAEVENQAQKEGFRLTHTGSLVSPGRKGFKFGALFENERDEKIQITLRPHYNHTEHECGIAVEIRRHNLDEQGKIIARLYDRQVWSTLDCESDEPALALAEDFVAQSRSALDPQEVLRLLNRSTHGDAVNYRKILDKRGEAVYQARLAETQADEPDGRRRWRYCSSG